MHPRLQINKTRIIYEPTDNNLPALPPGIFENGDFMEIRDSVRKFFKLWIGSKGMYNKVRMFNIWPADPCLLRLGGCAFQEVLYLDDRDYHGRTVTTSLHRRFDIRKHSTSWMAEGWLSRTVQIEFGTCIIRASNHTNAYCIDLSFLSLPANNG